MQLDLDRIECLIFDLDGTLVDSEMFCLEAYCDTVPDLDWDARYLARSLSRLEIQADHRGNRGTGGPQAAR